MGSARGNSSDGTSMPWFTKPAYSLTVKQQPERARLCSYKEENETMDRRPIDPPPIVEIIASDRAIGTEQLLDSTAFFVKVAIVTCTSVPLSSPSSPTQTPFSSKPLSHCRSVYSPVKTPLGADAITGEIVQTPEKLRLLDGRTAALCVFAKISVRVPGTFRLKFTLYEISEAGIVEVVHVVSKPFEVFSPKLFQGMHESTPLTRHLAAQGLKVKLRTDTGAGRANNKRRRVSSAQSYSTPSASSIKLLPHLTIQSSQPPKKSEKPSPRLLNLSQAPQDHNLDNNLKMRRVVSEKPKSLFGLFGRDEMLKPELIKSSSSPILGKRRFGDDVPPPSTDLSAFSLSRPQGGKLSSVSMTSADTPRLSSHSSSSSSSLSSTLSTSLSSAFFAPNRSMSSNSTQTPYSSTSTQSVIPARSSIRVGDDGVPILPPPASFGQQGQLEFMPPTVHQVLGEAPQRGRRGSGPHILERPSSPVNRISTTSQRLNQYNQPMLGELRTMSPMTLPPLRSLSQAHPEYN
nr:hypothetical protein L204_04075 [Cryptococcus depauperatus CBS 7855]